MFSSRELTTELVELSGWKPDGEGFSSGYLLRKIDYPRLERDVYDRWLAKRHHKTKRGSLVGPDNVHGWGDTPEDALCRLAIDMFKQGVL